MSVETPAGLSLKALAAKASVKQNGTHLFELERDKLLRINLNDNTAPFAWIKAGTMIARTGQLKFSRQSAREQGFAKVLKKAFTGEGMTLVKCEGSGVAFCADAGKLVSIIMLSDETVYLNGNDVLALSSSLTYDIKLMKGAGMMSGGLFNVKVRPYAHQLLPMQGVSGTGAVAFTCHGAVVVLHATAEKPVYTDPDATVAWTHPPTMKTDLSMKSFMGRGSGEEFQLVFNEGYVVVQPFEELPPPPSNAA
ncbi:Mitochondrial biogenesis protein AIM24 [Gracilaria domingensis]|nr:Mitochondrial biogenesis protein AIM24 [Gracilaria domingensis]